MNIPKLSLFIHMNFLGTQEDLRNQYSLHVSFEEGKNLAHRIGADGFIENYAKELRNVDETFAMSHSALLNDKRRRR